MVKQNRFFENTTIHISLRVITNAPWLSIFQYVFVRTINDSRNRTANGAGLHNRKEKKCGSVSHFILVVVYLYFRLNFRFILRYGLV